MNNLEKLRRSGKTFFTKEDIQRILSLSPAAAAVFCARAVKRGDIQRIKRGVYCMPSPEDAVTREDSFKLANYLVTPSYISLQTALSYHEISTQITLYQLNQSAGRKRLHSKPANCDIFTGRQERNISLVFKKGASFSSPNRRRP